jgi:hypothetical protein
MPVPECKTCASCEHGHKWHNGGGWRCTRPVPIGFSPVEGEQYRRPVACEFERSRLWRFLRADTYGPDGKYWAYRRPMQPPTSGSAVPSPIR